MPVCRNGRRGRLKICCGQPRVGSSPTAGSYFFNFLKRKHEKLCFFFLFKILFQKRQHSFFCIAFFMYKIILILLFCLQWLNIKAYFNTRCFNLFILIKFLKYTSCYRASVLYIRIHQKNDILATTVLCPGVYGT